ncbi:unnamed protein product [Prorocentrum cordatum]|uniref:CCHC-type domain-containing protein n=1 Tax=Prorocentrum cordatum TaxID=2364126 RepID=A0ABN9U873_9DINO|nr:unnamed protein product [Polarella glacialis]
MANEQQSGIKIPVWNGEASTLESFEEKVKLWVLGTKKDDRIYLGPRLVQAMDEDSQQWFEAKKVSLDDLVKEDGAEKVVEALKGVRGTVTMQEAVSKWREFMRGVYRHPGEGPKRWVSRFDIHLSKIGKALHAVCDEIPAQGFMHEFILGLILLDGTGLDPSEQAAVLATSGPKGNSYLYQDVKKAKGAHAVFDDADELAAYAEEVYDEAYIDGFEEAADITESAMTAAEDLMTAALGEEPRGDEEQGEDALAAAASTHETDEWTETAFAASRTFVEARKLINEVKNARGYFPVVGLGAYDALPTQPAAGAGRGRAVSRGGPPRKGKGKDRGGVAGRGKGRGQSQKRPAAPPKDSNSGTNEKFKGACLLCGEPGRKARDCPNRGKGAQGERRRAFNSFVGAADGYSKKVEFEDVQDVFVGTVNDEGESKDCDEEELDEFAAFSMDDCKGYALLDGGASRSVGGAEQLEYVNERLSEPMEVSPDKSLGFSFAGGDRADAPSRVTFNVKVLNDEAVSIYVLDRKSPVLLGIDMLKKYGLVIDYFHNTVYSHRFKREIPTRVLPSGHLALNLTALGNEGSNLVVDLIMCRNCGELLFKYHFAKTSDQMLLQCVRSRQYIHRLETTGTAQPVAPMMNQSSSSDSEATATTTAPAPMPPPSPPGATKKLPERLSAEAIRKLTDTEVQQIIESERIKIRQEEQQRLAKEILQKGLIDTPTDPTEVDDRARPSKRLGVSQMPKASRRLSSRVKSCVLGALIAATAALGEMPGTAWEAAETYGRLDLAEVACVSDSRLTHAMIEQGGKAERFSNWNGYDFSTRSGAEKLVKALRVKRPRRVWFSPPCGAECPWQNLNPVTAESEKKLIKTRRIQRNVKWAIGQLLNEGFCGIYLEQSGRCRSWTGNFRELKESMHGCRIHGCMYDMRDEQSGLLIRKDWHIATTDPQFEKKVGRTCPDLHLHMPLEGGTRVALSANYPVNLCRRIAQHFMTRATSDEALAYLVQAHNELDDELCAAGYRRLREKRPASEGPPPPPPKRPTLEPTAPESQGESAGGQVPAPDPDETGDAQVPPEGEAPPPTPESGGQEQSVGNLRLPLPRSAQNCTKAELRELEAIIAHIHRNFGHCSMSTVSAALKSRKADQKLIDLCSHYECPACKAAQRFQMRPIASSEPTLPAPGTEMGCDNFYWTHPRRAYQVRGTLCADYGNRFTQTSIHCQKGVEEHCGNTTAKEMKEVVLKDWIHHYGKPEVFRTDPEGCFKQVEQRAWVSGNGMEWRPEPGEAHWRMGVIERCIETVKDIATRLAWELPDDTDPADIFRWACVANNDLMRHQGYSPMMLMMGRTPSGQGLEQVENPSVLSANVVDKHFQEVTRIKAAAYKACVDHYLSEKTKRALLAKTRPFKTWEPGEKAHYWRGAKGNSHKTRPGIAGRFHGPATILMQEREMKNGVAVRRGVVWLVDGDRLARAAAAHLRTTTKAERTLESISAGSSDHFKKILQELTKGAYDDVVDQPGPGEWDDIPEGENVEVPDPPRMTTPRSMAFHQPDDHEGEAGSDSSGHEGAAPEASPPPMPAQNPAEPAPTPTRDQIDESEPPPEGYNKREASKEPSENPDPKRHRADFAGYLGHLCQKAPTLVMPELGRAEPESEGSANWVSPWEYDQKTKASDLVGFVGEDEPNLAIMIGFALEESDVDQLSRRPDKALAAMVKQNKVEVKLKDLTAEDREKLPIAKGNEIKSFLKYRVCEAASRAGVHPGALMKMRWVITRKETGDLKELMEISSEATRLRAAFGQLMWLATQGVPLIGAELSLLLAYSNSATVNTLLQANKLIRRTKFEATKELIMEKHANPCVVGYSDAAWNVRRDGSSQGGFLIFLTDYTLMQNREVQAASEAQEELEFCRLLLSEILSGLQAVKIPGALVLDCRGVFDALDRSESSALGMKDKRSALEALALKRGMAATSTSLRWCHSGAQLSDCMTKNSEKARASYNLWQQRGTWKLIYDANFISEKQRRQRGLQTLDQATYFAVDDDDAWQLYPEDLEIEEEADIPQDFRLPEAVSAMRHDATSVQ